MERYLTLKEAGNYAGSHSARWARRHLLPNVPHVDLPGAGAAMFKPSDIDNYLKRFRVEPLNTNAAVAQIFGSGKGR